MRHLEDIFRAKLGKEISAFFKFDQVKIQNEELFMNF